jgi:hypothetical protein
MYGLCMAYVWLIYGLTIFFKNVKMYPILYWENKIIKKNNTNNHKRIQKRQFVTFATRYQLVRLDNYRYLT